MLYRFNGARGLYSEEVGVPSSLLAGVSMGRRRFGVILAWCELYLAFVMLVRRSKMVCMGRQILFHPR